MTEAFEQSKENKVRQLREKAAYDKSSVYAVLDAALVAHVAFVQNGAPIVVPMIYGREGDTLYLHGARKARVIRMLEQTPRACLNVTLVDGIVFARSAFNSSMNYRSATIYGTPRLIDDEAEKLRTMKAISEHTMPGRWDELRDPLDREVKMTGVIALEIETASAKVSAGMPEDEEEDYEIPIWAGVLPLESKLTGLHSDERVLDGVEPSTILRSLEGRVL